MSWSVRHEGSPKSVDGLTVEQIAEGLRDGVWAPSDEVRGPGEEAWLALENHPQFAELAWDVDQPEKPPQDDETRLDMNPLIDVCLVLLIFFMLTATYANMQKYLESPNLADKDAKGIKTVSQKDIKETMVKVTARMQDGKPAIRIEEAEVAPDELVGALVVWVKKERKTQMWLDLADDVPYDYYIRIRDAAAGAGIDKVLLKVGKAPNPQK
jgi:biopolymer transport protein ExbD